MPKPHKHDPRQLSAPSSSVRHGRSGSPSVLDTTTAGAAAHVHPVDRAGGIKRRRKTLSCYACRKRKLGCDRGHPACARCVKSGYPEACTYDLAAAEADDVGSTSGGSSTVEGGRMPSMDPLGASAAARNLPFRSFERGVDEGSRSPDDLGSLVRTQAVQIARLERRLALLESPSPQAATQTMTPTVPGSVVARNPAIDPSLKPIVAAADAASFDQTDFYAFRGKDYRTQWHGPTNPIGCLSHFPEVRVFMSRVMEADDGLTHVRHELAILEKGRRKQTKNIVAMTDAQLLTLMPTDRSTVEPLIGRYIRTIEQLYRVLYVPSFWHDYHGFWQKPNEARPGFVAIMLLMIASVQITVTEPAVFLGNMSAVREQASLYVKSCEAWLNRQSKKHLNLEYFQVAILLQIAKQMNQFKQKQNYGSAGSLLRFALAAGFHRDPTLVHDGVTPFDQEMRRRLWATMVEWDLQASCNRGLPSASTSISFDTELLQNVDDTEWGFDGTGQYDDIPQPQPENTFTACSFLQVSLRSFALRNSLNTLLNDLNTSLTYEEVLEYETKIYAELSAIPEWSDESDSSDDEEETPDSCRDLPVRTLLDIQLRQYLLLLHHAFARKAKTNEQYNYSLVSCYNNAGIIIAKYDELKTSGDTTLMMLRHDVLRASLLFCHCVFIAAQSSVPTMDYALAHLETKMQRLGEGFEQLWYFASAYSLSLSQVVPPPEAERRRPQIVEIVSQLYRKVMALQDPNVKAQILEEEKTRQAGGAVPSAIIPTTTGNVEGLAPFNVLSSHRSMQPGPPPGQGPGQFMEFTDLEQWMMQSYSGGLDPTL